MENCTKFNDLEAHLRELFKSASYSESTVKDMDFILRAFTNYMNANGMEEYSPEIGEILIHYCRETLKVCDSRVSRAKVIVGKLNRLYQGLDGEEALWLIKSCLLNYRTVFQGLWIHSFLTVATKETKRPHFITSGGFAADF